MMSVLSVIFRRTIASVPFGILLMVLIALYIAVGSGRVSLREWLEMDELLFFNWWPLKVLIVLLVTNLTIVTVTRIPLTPPRYGVWCIHMGIILLCMSLSAYYYAKTEGLTPLVKGRTTDHYYDRWERALYARTQFGTSPPMVLNGLPRFHEYDDAFGNAKTLDKPSFRGLDPHVRTLDASGQRLEIQPLATALGLKDPIKLDVVAYYPYASAERYRIDEKIKNTALRVKLAENAQAANWIVANESADSVLPLGPAVLEHRNLPTQADVNLATNAAKRLHKLTIKVGDLVQETFVEPGESIDIGNTGYTVHVEGFTPQFELSDRSGKSDMLTVHISRQSNASTSQPATTAPSDFRRTILSTINVQTDFDLHADGAGPFGKRIRDHLLDDGIQLGYTFSDPTKLLPTMEAATVKYLLFTATDTPGITMLRVSSRDTSVVTSTPDSKFDLHVSAPSPMLGVGDEQELAVINVERFDHVAASTGIVAVPKAQRSGETSRGGEGQMVKVRVRCGDFSGEFPVPYSPFAVENVWGNTPKIHIPGATGDFQLMLGNQRLLMPMSVRLDKFEPIPYPGGDTNRPGVMRDFVSSITLIDRETGESKTQETHLNNPAFFEIPSKVPLVPNQSWLLSQATWDPNDHDTTVLQIGNRPGVHMMVLSVVMIFGGLFYAFYVKPLIIRRMKANAIRAAQAKKAQRISEMTNEPRSSPLAPVIGGEG